MKRVLLTISGNIPDALASQIEQKQRPEADYWAMARQFDADLLDYAGARKIVDGFGRMLERTSGPNAMLAWACFMQRHRYRVIMTDGEQVGIPLASFLKFFGSNGHRPMHLMIVHILSVWKKALLLDRFGLHEYIDKFLVYSTWQQQYIRERWALSDDRVVFTPFMVDSAFFSSSALPSERNPWIEQLQKPIIASVGLERRDYPTLIEAVRGLDVRVVIAAASPWSKQSDSTGAREIPDNVSVRKFTQYELRELYAASSFLVMPLHDVEFQAGVTAILEAMAMERAVVCTRTRGQTGVVREGETGLYVPPQDVAALRNAILQLLKNPADAARMGKAGRKVIDEEMSLERYTERLGRLVTEAEQHLVSGRARTAG